MNKQQAYVHFQFYTEKNIIEELKPSNIKIGA